MTHCINLYAQKFPHMHDAIAENFDELMYQMVESANYIQDTINPRQIEENNILLSDEALVFDVPTIK